MGMVNQEVSEYVRACLTAGVAKEQIVRDLMGKGWLQKDIEAAFEANGHLEIIVPLPVSEDPDPTVPGHVQASVVVALIPAYVSLWLAAVSAATIALLVYFGISVMSPSGLSLMTLYTESMADGHRWLLLLLPATVIGLCSMFLGWWQGRRIYKREQKRVQAFFFGTSVYLVLVFLALGIISSVLVKGIGMVASDVSFAVGLIFSVAFQASIQILYVGLLLCMVLLLTSLCRAPLAALHIPSTRIVVYRYMVIGAAVLLALYVFSVAAPLASVLNQQWLCHAVYSDQAKNDCFLNLHFPGYQF